MVQLKAQEETFEYVVTYSNNFDDSDYTGNNDLNIEDYIDGLIDDDTDVLGVGTYISVNENVRITDFSSTSKSCLQYFSNYYEKHYGRI